MREQESDDLAAHEEAIETAAASWLYEKDEGFAPNRAEAFFVWCKADPRHAAAAARVERSLELLTEMPLAGDALNARFGPIAGAPGTRRLLSWSLSSAGLVAALVIVGLFLVRMPSANADIRHYVADVDEARRVDLPDGSVVDVNAGSEIIVLLTARERRITIAAGEAHFEVAHDQNRPFIVTAGRVVSVRAVGTSFNVKIVDGSIEVLVMEGRVELAQVVNLTVPDVNCPYVSAGEYAVVPRNREKFAPRIEKAYPGLIRATLAWHNRVTTFSDVPLRELVANFNVRNTVHITIADEELAARKMGGSFALNEVEALVRLLEQDGDVRIERRSSDEIILHCAR